jgi:hypothetical protein
MTHMSSLPVIDWDYADRMHHANKGPGGGDVFFTYDGSGQRVRKVFQPSTGTSRYWTISDGSGSSVLVAHFRRLAEPGQMVSAQGSAPGGFSGTLLAIWRIVGSSPPRSTVSGRGRARTYTPAALSGSQMEPARLCRGMR